METLFIIGSFRDERLLNEKLEFIGKRRHQNKLLFKTMNHQVLWIDI